MFKNIYFSIIVHKNKQQKKQIDDAAMDATKKSS